MQLKRLNGTYYLRYVLLTTLKAKFQASDIKFTLNTFNRSYARELAAQCYVRCCALSALSFKSLEQVINYVRSIPTLMDKLTPLHMAAMTTVRHE